jgi:hypothetical protein
MARKYKCKEFKLSDGTVMTARGIVAKYDVPLGTTRTRLSSGVRDINRLNKPPLPHKRNRLGDPSKKHVIKKEYKVSEIIKGRNFFDPLSRLFLMTA